MTVIRRTTKPVPDAWRVFGHSWFQYSTGPSGDQTGRVDALFRSAMDIEWNNWRNYAVGGARAMSNKRTNGGYARMLWCLNPPPRTTGPYAPDGGGTVICWGINDLAYFNPTVNTWVIASCVDAIRATVSRARSSVLWEENNAKIVWSGTASSSVTTAHNGFGSNGDFASGGYSAAMRRMTSTGSIGTLTLPTDYKGEPVVFAFSKAGGALGGTVTFGGTSGATGTFYTGGGQTEVTYFENGYTVKRITNLTSAAAGTTITMTSSSLDASGAIDFDCVWLESLNPPPVIVCDVARPGSNGYGGYGSWTGTELQKDQACLDLNTALGTMIAEFDGMVQMAYCDTAIGKDQSLTSDGVHPNEAGAGEIVDALVDARNRLIPPGTSNSYALSYNGPSPRTASQRRPRLANYYYGSDSMLYSNGTAFATAGGSGVHYTPVAGELYAVPFFVSEAREVFLRLGIEIMVVGTVAGTIRLGICDDINMSGYPQQLLSNGEGSSGTGSPQTALSVATTPAAPSVRDGASLVAGFGWVADPGLNWLLLKIETTGTGQTYRAISGQSDYMPNRPSNGTHSASLFPNGYCAWRLTGQATGAFTDFSFPSGATPVTTAPLVQAFKSK